ncbi:MAG TPA: polynucleotide 5'-hydroxyl-kinase, partial [Actinomycetota bacterium]|nr:polynucleotide 5'-hydroxyl-kinase [Actinomycetota bacterium]
MDEHEELVERAVTARGLTVLLGGLDTGKTSLARAIATKGAEQGLAVGFVDSDVGQSTVGPPTTVGLRMVHRPEDLADESLNKADALAFVGSASPQGHALSLVAGARLMADRARAEGADVIVVDTTGYVTGVYAQILKFQKVNLLQPDLVVGLERGQEIEPLLGIVRRNSAADVVALPVHAEVVPTSVEQRAVNREEAFKRYFAEPLQRWRVKPSVFTPALPALFDLAQLDHLVVGLADGKGGCLGIGYLEHLPEEGALRLISPAAEGPKALMLGSVRLDDGARARRVDLRNLFGSD